MINDRERAALREIEDRLRADDPEWDLEHPPPDTRRSGTYQRRFECAAHVVALVLSIALTGITLASSMPGPASFYVIVSGLLAWQVGRLLQHDLPTTSNGHQVGSYEVTGSRR